MERRALATLAVRFVRQRVHTRGIDPPIEKIEQGADRDGEIQRVVRPARGARDVQVGGCDPRRLAIHLVDESKQRLVRFVETRRLQVGQDRVDQRGIAEQLRRNCGVGLQSKRAVIALRRKRSDELAEPWTERCRSAQDLLREPRQVLRRARQIREQMPDLRVFSPARLRLLDEQAIWAWLRVLFDAWQEHRFH